MSEEEPQTETADAGEEDAPVKEEESTAVFEPVVSFEAHGQPLITPCGLP